MLISAMGLGVPEVTRADGALDHITVRMSENFECIGQKSEVPTSHFMTGFLAGVMSVILEKPMGCGETRCIATGAKYCEFDIHKV
jgi:predicted hydrocarbon binding protein